MAALGFHASTVVSTARKAVLQGPSDQVAQTLMIRFAGHIPLSSALSALCERLHTPCTLSYVSPSHH